MGLDLGRSALVVVDVQNDFVHPKGKVGTDGDVAPLLAAVDRIDGLVRAARAAAVPVVYVRVTHGPAVDNPAYQARYAARGMAIDDLLCADGAWGAAFYEGLTPPEPGELIVTKHAYDAFAVESLPIHLRGIGVDTVVVTGVVTELCVMGTVAGAFEHGFHVVVPREATGSVAPEAAHAALSLVRTYYGTVVSASDVLAAWGTAATTGPRAAASGSAT